MLIADLLALLAAHGTDFTIFFRTLGDGTDAARDLMVDRDAFDAWAARYRARLAAESGDEAARRERMNRVNPKFVLRNHLAQVAINKATRHKDFSEIDRLLAVLRRPFDEQPRHAVYAAPPPDWAKQIEVSCSS